MRLEMPTGRGSDSAWPAGFCSQAEPKPTAMMVVVMTMDVADNGLSCATVGPSI